MTINVLVTGGNGMVGMSMQRIFKYLDINKKYNFYYSTRQDADLRVSEQVNNLFEQTKPEIIIHAASIVGGLYENSNKNYHFLMENLKMHINIIECCKKYKVRKIINILSTCIFPAENVKYPLTSDQIHNGLSDYSNIGYSYSKRMLSLMSELSDIHTINITPTNIYGKNDNYNFQQGHVLPVLMHKCHISNKIGIPVEVLGTGISLRQFILDDDLSKIIYHFMDNKFESNVSVIASPPEKDAIYIKDLVLLLKDITKLSGEIVYNKSFSDGQLKKLTDNQELNKYMPGFKFTNLRDGLENVYEYFVNNYENLRT